MMSPLEDNGNFQTVKSTFIMGSSSIINIGLGIIRHKIIALLIGTAGIGLLGIYQSLSSLLLNIFGLGINESGARQIAIFHGSKDKYSLARVYISIKRIALITGLFGIIFISIFSKELSLLTFKNSKHALEIILLSFSILLNNIFGAQTALIQGSRKINYLAKINALGPFWGTLFSLPLIYFFRMKAVVSYLIVMSATNLISSWYYKRKIELSEVRINWANSINQGIPLIKLGSALMIGTNISFGISYLVRLLIIKGLGLDAAGIFQASSIFSSIYVGIILKSMATDFYPRLSAISENHNESNKLVNQQIEAGLLLGAPGILLTLAFAPILMVILYSKDFIVGFNILRWQILGVMLQVITWPLGYIFRAKAAGQLFVITELFYGICYLSTTWIGMKLFGLSGIGIAFFASNLLYLGLVYPIVHTKYDFSFDHNTLRKGIMFFSVAIISLLTLKLIPSHFFIVNIPLLLAISFYSYKKLNLSAWFKRIRQKN